MIIPSLSYSPESSIDDLVEQIKHWSLFGQAALNGVGQTDLENIEHLSKRVGGSVDLHIEMSTFDEQAALAFLNAGATSILSRNTELVCESIPEERITFLRDDDSPDEAVPLGQLLSLSAPSAERIAELEMARIDCVVDADLLQPEMITEFFKTVLITDRPDGLWSTVIVDPLGIALGLAYSNEESLLYAIENRVGTYWSRSRDGLWIKGETSGATQQLLNIRMDCDRDCLRFMVTQDAPGFCHRDTHSCFGHERTIQSVVERLADRIGDSDAKSFTRKLANDPDMLEKKLLEEAKELSDASQTDDDHEIAWEAADVLYFTLVAMLKNGVSLDRVHQELARRMNRVVRRPNKLEKENNNE